MSIIDIHCHATTRAFLGELARDHVFGLESDGDRFIAGKAGPVDPMLYDLDKHLAHLDKMGIGLQVISPPPRFVSDARLAADRELARRINRHSADVIRNAGGKIQAFAVPSLTEPEHAVSEVKRAMDEDGLMGVFLPTSAAGRPLDDGAFEALFAECNRRKCPIFMHPTTGIERSAINDYTMLQLVAWPTETALCIARMIFSGVFERYPDLRLILAHGGGTLPYLAGRLDLGREAPKYEFNAQCREHISRPPSTYLSQIYYDSLVVHKGALGYLMDLVGADRILFGSDYPFEIADTHGAKTMPILAEMAPDLREGILSGNAQRVLFPSA